jgi:hypothetical protein
MSCTITINHFPRECGTLGKKRVALAMKPQCATSNVGWPIGLESPSSRPCLRQRGRITSPCPRHMVSRAGLNGPRRIARSIRLTRSSTRARARCRRAVTRRSPVRHRHGNGGTLKSERLNEPPPLPRGTAYGQVSRSPRKEPTVKQPHKPASRPRKRPGTVKPADPELDQLDADADADAETEDRAAAVAPSGWYSKIPASPAGA